MAVFSPCQISENTQGVHNPSARESSQTVIYHRSPGGFSVSVANLAAGGYLVQEYLYYKLKVHNGCSGA
ncbi:MAG: hypothetical protein ISR91_06945 [Candidatus Delongbacteria bacterium]|nr:hypothetical protein [Candidatus Delongbacteria bacterium]